MMLLGKIALGFGAGVLMMGAYTFHEGVLRVDVDENRANGSHVHFWAPAAVVPMAMHLVPTQDLQRGGEQAWQYMPLVHAVAKELSKYPETVLVEVQDGEQHALVRTHNGSLQIDVDSPDEHVHVRCPLEMIDDVARQLAESAPPA
jgi:hypothetical protein